MIFHPLTQRAPFVRELPEPFSSDGPSMKMAGIFQDIAGRDGILSIKFVAAGERSRKIISRSNSRPTGRFPSQRMSRMVHWDSPHELNAYRLLDSNPFVVAFAEQPCIIHYRLGGKDFRHYPDTLVQTARVKALWEVKTAADANRPEVVARTQLMTEHLPAYGYEYAVVLAEDLAQEPRLSNACFVVRHGRQSLSFEQKEYARRLFADIDFLRWQDVRDGRHAPFTVQQACHLVLNNVLQLKFDEKFGAETLLTKIPNASLFGGGNG